MKKILFMLLFCSFIYAEDFNVVSVLGTAQYLKGGWTPITTGMTLKDTDQINVGLNSRLVVSNGKVFTIKSLSKGKLLEFLSKGSVKIGTKITESAVSSDSNKNKTTNVSTSATRASDTQNDLEWAQ